MSFKLGKQGEELITMWFTDLGYKCVKSEDRSHDLMLGLHTPLYLEVKNDIYSRRSGNIAIEFFNDKQDKISGIAASISNLWCHIHYDREFTLISFCPTKKLRKFTEEIQPKKIITAGGDNNSSMKLYSREVFMETFYTHIIGESIRRDVIEGVLDQCKSD